MSIYIIAIFFVVSLMMLVFLSSSQHDEENTTNTVFKNETSLAEKKGAVGEQIIKVLVLTQLDRQQYFHFKTHYDKIINISMLYQNY